MSYTDREGIAQSRHLNQHAADLARHLLGEPNRALSTRRDPRFGSKGSLSVITAGPKAGSFFNHEQGTAAICSP
jgi:hypothetical protein